MVCVFEAPTDEATIQDDSTATTDKKKRTTDGADSTTTKKMKTSDDNKTPTDVWSVSFVPTAKYTHVHQCLVPANTARCDFANDYDEEACLKPYATLLKRWKPLYGIDGASFPPTNSNIKSFGHPDITIDTALYRIVSTKHVLESEDCSDDQDTKPTDKRHAQETEAQSDDDDDLPLTHLLRK